MKRKGSDALPVKGQSYVGQSYIVKTLAMKSSNQKHGEFGGSSKIALPHRYSVPRGINPCPGSAKQVQELHKPVNMAVPSGRQCQESLVFLSPSLLLRFTMAGRKLDRGIAEWWTGLGLGCVLDIPLLCSSYTEITLLSLLRKVFLNPRLRYLSPRIQEEQ